MTDTVSNTQAMIAGMDPALDAQLYCFVSPEGREQMLDLMQQALATFREDEGLSLIVPSEAAEKAGLDVPLFTRITLQVHSDLEGFGLTSAVSSALADAGIACNMVAALRHDHVFVPAARAEDALRILHELAQSPR